MKISVDEFHELMDYLANSIEGGTTQSIPSLVEEFFNYEKEIHDLDMEDLFAIDQAFFTCDQCGWTMLIEDMADSDTDRICNQCEEENSQ